MIRILCDVCDQELKNKDFFFEATLMEVEKVIVINKQLQSQEQMSKRTIQVCKGCYDKHFAELLKLK